jgi:hypothetical protein
MFMFVGVCFMLMLAFMLVRMLLVFMVMMVPVGVSVGMIMDGWFVMRV